MSSVVHRPVFACGRAAMADAGDRAVGARTGRGPIKCECRRQNVECRRRKMLRGMGRARNGARTAQRTVPTRRGKAEGRMQNVEGGILHLQIAERRLQIADWGRTSTEANEGNEEDPRHQTFGLFGLEGHGAGAVTCFLRWLQRAAQNGSRREAC